MWREEPGYGARGLSCGQDLMVIETIERIWDFSLWVEGSYWRLSSRDIAWVALYSKKYVTDAKWRINWELGEIGWRQWDPQATVSLNCSVFWWNEVGLKQKQWADHWGKSVPKAEGIGLKREWEVEGTGEGEDNLRFPLGNLSWRWCYSPSYEIQCYI